MSNHRARLARLEARPAPAPGRFICYSSDADDPRHVTYDGRQVTLEELQTIIGPVSAADTIIHILYREETHEQP